MAVTADIKTDRYGTADQAPEPGSQPVAANTIVYGGTIALVNTTGYLKASDSPLTTDTCIGIVSKQTDNRTSAFSGGGSGAVEAPIDRGTFWLSYDPANAPTNPATGQQTMYVKDAQTVSTASAAGCVAGICKRVDTSISKCAVALGTAAGTIF